MDWVCCSSGSFLSGTHMVPMLGGGDMGAPNIPF